MFDEHISRSARRLKIRQISFKHPLEDALFSAFRPDADEARSVVLTGTAGDGKSHLCGRVWEMLGGSSKEWSTNEVYFRLQDVVVGGRSVTVHVIRDFTALPDSDDAGRYRDKDELLGRMAASLFADAPDDVYLLTANDGQLMEAWRKASGTEAVRTRALLEARLINETDPEPNARLTFLNLSTVSSTVVFDLVSSALLDHEGWSKCYEEQQEAGFFGPRCTIRRNYELLKSPLLRSRLRSLFELCDLNELHTPIRRVLMLLVNAILGHPDAKDQLLLPGDVRGVVERGTGYKASIYGNLFGANLVGTKRESLEIFEYFSRFGIGQETTNRIDNILIFGAEDEKLLPYYQSLMVEDLFYGATDRFRAAQHDYVEGPENVNEDDHEFLKMLVDQRRALFFKIPPDLVDDLKLWHMTVFTGAGEFLDDVAGPLKAGQPVARKIVERLVKGLNRIFTGMLVSTERDLLLATSLSLSTARVSQLLEDKIPVRPRGQEYVEVTTRSGFPSLDVSLPGGRLCSLRLNLTRYEFLMRVSAGALPGNFSRECYEDILAFKSSLLSAARPHGNASSAAELSFSLLSLDSMGNPADDTVEVTIA
ncbi:hypothetical protein [Bradyrhizobium sp. 15]|uniref:hypothetical protein n=1 Tax=Bradyrhizobium sp. 15 TaxID=2782633 RepID=UPI001FF719D1|nr:hypothetical protein [Bradyrhizobium sp. 15]